MCLGASPNDPRSSAIGLLLARGTRFLLPLPFRGEGRGEAQGRRFGRPLFSYEPVELLCRQVVVVLVVESHHRGVLACAEALDLLVAEEPIGRDLARLLHPDRLLHVVDDLVRPAQHAAEVRAHIEAMLADRLEMEQRVEGCDTLDVTGVELESLGHLAHRVRCQVAELFLSEVERRHHRQPRLRVFGGKLFDLVEEMRRQNAFRRGPRRLTAKPRSLWGIHRSTSPSTVSAVPMIATMSAIMWFIAIRSSGWRLTNDAARNLTRRGLCVPSLPTEDPVFPPPAPAP